MMMGEVMMMKKIIEQSLGDRRKAVGAVTLAS